MNIKAALPVLLAALMSVAACANETDPVAGASATPDNAPVTGQVSKARSTPADLPKVVVYKSPSCGCCVKWVQHMRDEGFEVDVHDVDNVHPVKERVGLPAGKGSCHTAEVDGYFVEGHVPAADVKRLLAERPAARGLAVPGMPLGSPGMEVPDGRVQAFDVELVATDGSTSRFSRHGD